MATTIWRKLTGQGDIDPSSISFGEAINNLFTGNYDYIRTQAQNAFSASEAEKARQFSKQEAQLNRDFQEQMSNTAYQRAVSDMKAAGLNPAMMFDGGAGGGASTPSGALASSSQASASSAYQSSQRGFQMLANLALGLASQGVTSALGFARLAKMR